MYIYVCVKFINIFFIPDARMSYANTLLQLLWSARYYGH